MDQNMMGMLIQFVYHPAEFNDLWAGTDYGHDFDCHEVFLSGLYAISLSTYPTD
jgi:hypothetical protein